MVSKSYTTRNINLNTTTMKKIGLLLLLPVLLLAGCKNKKGQEVAVPAVPAAFQTPPVVSWAKNAVIYEVNIRQYTKEGTLDRKSVV